MDESILTKRAGDQLKSSLIRDSIILASRRQDLSSGIPIRSYQIQPAQLQRLARIVKFRLKQVLILLFPISKSQRRWSAPLLFANP